MSRGAAFFIAMGETINVTDLDLLARKKFTAEKFVRVPGVCIFAEHETTDSKGQAQKYDQRALQAIVDRCNERIADTEDFAVLADGHTPDRDELVQGAKMPDVLGFAGPFRLGKIGNRRPRYAIFADEWHFKDVAEKLTRKPRRSVELWMNEDMRERFIDPIAALGAETPRLDLGVRLSRLSTGQVVEKYTAVAPSGANTFVPDFDHDKEQYAMLAPEELKQIIAALMETPHFQWVAQQMNVEEAGEVEEPVDELEAPAEEAPLEEEPVDEAPLEEPPLEEALPAEEPLPEGPADEEPDLEAYEADKAPEETPPYLGADKRDEDEEVVKMSRQDRKDERERYRKLERENREMADKYTALEKEMTKIRREKADAERTAEIERLAQEYAIDRDAELERCLYAKGSAMSNKDFDNHVETIERYATRSPVGFNLPRGRLPETSDEEVQKYQAAQEYAETQRKAGKRVSWAEALAHVSANGEN